MYKMISHQYLDYSTDILRYKRQLLINNSLTYLNSIINHRYKIDEECDQIAELAYAIYVADPTKENEIKCIFEYTKTSKLRYNDAYRKYKELKRSETHLHTKTTYGSDILYNVNLQELYKKSLKPLHNYQRFKTQYIARLNELCLKEPIAHIQDNEQKSNTHNKARGFFMSMDAILSIKDISTQLIFIEGKLENREINPKNCSKLIKKLIEIQTHLESLEDTDDNLKKYQSFCNILANATSKLSVLYCRLINDASLKLKSEQFLQSKKAIIFFDAIADKGGFNLRLRHISITYGFSKYCTDENAYNIIKRLSIESNFIEKKLFEVQNTFKLTNNELITILRKLFNELTLFPDANILEFILKNPLNNIDTSIKELKGLISESKKNPDISHTREKLPYEFAKELLVYGASLSDHGEKQKQLLTLYFQHIHRVKYTQTPNFTVSKFYKLLFLMTERSYTEEILSKFNTVFDYDPIRLLNEPIIDPIQIKITDEDPERDQQIELLQNYVKYFITKIQSFGEIKSIVHEPLGGLVKKYSIKDVINRIMKNYIRKRIRLQINKLQQSEELKDITKEIETLQFKLKGKDDDTSSSGKLAQLQKNAKTLKALIRKETRKQKDQLSTDLSKMSLIDLLNEIVRQTDKQELLTIIEQISSCIDSLIEHNGETILDFSSKNKKKARNLSVKALTLKHDFMSRCRFADAVPNCLVSRNTTYNKDMADFCIDPLTLVFEISVNVTNESVYEREAVGHIMAFFGIEHHKDKERPIIIWNGTYLDSKWKKESTVRAIQSKLEAEIHKKFSMIEAHFLANFDGGRSNYGSEYKMPMESVDVSHLSPIAMPGKDPLSHRHSDFPLNELNTPSKPTDFLRTLPTSSDHPWQLVLKRNLVK